MEVCHPISSQKSNRSTFWIIITIKIVCVYPVLLGWDLSPLSRMSSAELQLLFCVPFDIQATDFLRDA